MTTVAAPGLDRRTRGYVDEVLAVVADFTPILEAYLVGSAATGAFDPRRSDLDVVVVAERPLGDARKALVARLAELPNPVRNLELVVYVAGCQPPDFDLNVSEGAERPDEPAFWFVLDAALAEQHAAPLVCDLPWKTFFAAIPEASVRSALLESARWSEEQPADDQFARLNAARARHYLERGEWISKDEAARELAR